MKRKRFTEEQIIGVLKEAEQGFGFRTCAGSMVLPRRPITGRLSAQTPERMPGTSLTSGFSLKPEGE